MAIRGYGAFEPKSDLREYSYDPLPLGRHDIRVSISHCGICHSDIHLIDDDWQMSRYPFIPGHEIVGIVKGVGTDVQHLKDGDRVGVGWQRSACLQCPDCIRGDDNLCSNQEATCVGHHGGFAEEIHLDGRFAFRIPERLASENAAPLLCGGITVYSPFRYYDVKTSQRVGVIGIGGLGHLALQFAAAFGCEVTAFSSTAAKAEEAKSFGAAHFVSSTDRMAMKHAAGSLDFILNTVNADLDWNEYLKLLRPNGRLCFVGAPPSPLQIPAFSLIVGRKSVCGSPIGSRSVITEMLDFCSRHRIVAQAEVVPLHEVNAALRRVRENRARYRMVLKTGN